MVDDYVNIKHGRSKPSYAHPVMEEMLAETYGVMCIHEDARRVAGGRHGEADQAREARGPGSVAEPGDAAVRDQGVRRAAARRGVVTASKLTLENGFSVTARRRTTRCGPTTAGKRCRNSTRRRTSWPSALSLPQEAPTCAELAPWLGADEDVAYLLGLLVGDGCLTGSGIDHRDGHEAAPRRSLVAWLAERLPDVARCTSTSHVRSWYINLSRPELAERGRARQPQDATASFPRDARPEGEGDEQEACPGADLPLPRRPCGQPSWRD